MSFGNSSIYPFPAVQYIPLSINTIAEGRITKTGPKFNMMKLIAGPELLTIRQELANDYGVNIPDSFPPKVFPIFAVNLKVTDVKYRSFFVTMLGNPEPNYYQLFSISTERLYKQKLFFNVFDSISGKLLTNYSLFISQAPPLKH